MHADQTADQTVIELKCPSKINLGLRVVGRTPDGLHLLQSLFLPISFGDDLMVEPGTLQVETQWVESPPPHMPPLPREPENLVHRFLSVLPPKLAQWKVRIEKRVPIGSGLGGGSSNVGTLARWLCTQFPESRDEIQAAARTMGADVAFFLDPAPQWVEGTGDKLSRWEGGLPDWTLVLVFPPVTCSTPTIYRRYLERGVPFSKPISKPTDIEDYLKFCGNDLEKVADDPPLPEVLNLLKQTDPIASGMSGSGSTCFAIFDQRQGAQNKLKALRNSIRSNQCKSVTLLM